MNVPQRLHVAQHLIHKYRIGLYTRKHLISSLNALHIGAQLDYPVIQIKGDRAVWHYDATIDSFFIGIEV
jgi:hypothetical protein